MNVREWALITFTILAQMSVGSFLVLWLLHSLARRKVGLEKADQMSDRLFLAIGPVFVLGLAASLLHLGNPWKAHEAVANVATSWLSREVLFGVLFTGSAVLFALMQYRKIGSAVARGLVAWVAALVGVVLVLSMSMVYMLPTQPSWNTVMTPVSFFTTTLLLGALAVGAALVANYGYLGTRDTSQAKVQCELLRDSLRWIAVASVALLGVEFVVAPLSLASLGAAGSTAALGSLQLVVGTFGPIFALRLVLVFLGAGVLGIFLYQSSLSPTRERAMGNLAYAAFFMVFVSELLGRFLFYATQAKIGI